MEFLIRTYEGEESVGGFGELKPCIFNNGKFGSPAWISNHELDRFLNRHLLILKESQVAEDANSRSAVQNRYKIVPMKFGRSVAAPRDPE